MNAVSHVYCTLLSAKFTPKVGMHITHRGQSSIYREKNLFVGDSDIQKYYLLFVYKSVIVTCETHFVTRLTPEFLNKV